MEDILGLMLSSGRMENESENENENESNNKNNNNNDKNDNGLRHFFPSPSWGRD